MKTVVFNKNAEWLKDKYETIEDFLWTLDSELIYEEYLERKLLTVKQAPKSDFVNL